MSLSESWSEFFACCWLRLRPCMGSSWFAWSSTEISFDKALASNMLCCGWWPPGAAEAPSKSASCGSTLASPLVPAFKLVAPEWCKAEIFGYCRHCWRPWASYWYLSWLERNMSMFPLSRRQSVWTWTICWAFSPLPACSRRPLILSCVCACCRIS